MNRQLRFLMLLLALPTFRLAGEAVHWPGEAAATTDPRESSNTNLPGVVDLHPGDRKLQSLLFTVEDPKAKKADGQFLELGKVFSQATEHLTVSCFVYPTRPKIQEDLVSCKSPMGTTGFRLFKNWAKWGFEYGDGNECRRVHARVDLEFNTWQHLAVVFDKGTVRFYRDGLPVGEFPPGSGGDSIAGVPGRRYRIGSGAGPWKHNVYPFAGMLTAISITETSLDRHELMHLIRQATLQPTP